jgi:hypothetical protein
VLTPRDSEKVVGPYEYPVQSGDLKDRAGLREGLLRLDHRQDGRLDLVRALGATGDSP